MKIWIIIALFLEKIIILNCLRCYSCSSYISQACSDPFKQQSTELHDIITCKHDWVCYKTKTHTRHRLQRGCSTPEQFRSMCDSLIDSEFCHSCKTDLCNKTVTSIFSSSKYTVLFSVFHFILNRLF